MNDTGFGHRLCAGWARCYTRRVPPELARQRRDELLSDLWEHAADGDGEGQGRVAHQLDVIGRMLAGVPADLSWRRGVLRSHQPQPAVLMTTNQPVRNEVTMTTRWICRIIGHNYVRADPPGGGTHFYLHCARCGRDKDNCPTGPWASAGNSPGGVA